MNYNPDVGQDFCYEHLADSPCSAELELCLCCCCYEALVVKGVQNV